ncbi:MAG: hypothetical protein AB1346_10955 [Thermodesulfobacteriota bacterium]
MAATSTTANASILNGSVNPNGQATTVHFEWGENAGMAGAVSTPDQSVGNGVSDASFTASLTGLASSTTYYYRVVATNAAGTTYGAIQGFTTATPASAPTVQSLDATGITSGAATLNGNVIPNGPATTAHFEWGTSPTLADATPTVDNAVGSGSTGVSVSASLSGLSQSTVYYCRLVATNPYGTSYGSIKSFTTEVAYSPPSVQTLGATGIAAGAATLNGVADPKGLATVAYFQWGTSPSLADATPTADNAIGSGTAGVPVAAALSGLAPATTYRYRLVAVNPAGTTYGAIAGFTTAEADAPTASTLEPTGVSAGSATLNATVNPNGLATTARIVIGVDSGLAGAREVGEQPVGSGTSDVAMAVPVDDLTPSTTYYYRVVASNANGSSSGEILCFTTPAGEEPSQGIIFSKMFTSYGGSGVFTIDFHPIAEHGDGGHIAIRIMDTPTTYFEFSTRSASDPTRGSFIKVRRGVVVDSAEFTHPYSQGGSYAIRITMDQSQATVEAFGGTATLSSNDQSNPLVYFEVWTSDQDAYYDNIRMEPGFLDDFSADTTGSYSLFFISGSDSTFTYDAAGKRAKVTAGGS